MQIDDMNMRQLDEAIKSGKLTKKQEEKARKRLEEISNRDFSPNPRNKQIPVPKPRPTPKQRGFQAAAHGGMIHRGRKANYNG